MRTIIVTGGAGFIGSALIRRLMAETGDRIVNVDKLTYAANLKSLQSVSGDPRYHFVQADIVDRSAMQHMFETFRPDAVMNLAAETHVDRSIDGPAEFIQTNLVGTFTLLDAALRYWEKLAAPAKSAFRFQHISTDEVFGSLGETGLFSETTPYSPNSPYSASKAGSDHLVCAWHHTYGLPTTVTNCSNNYGPYQFPEKLIPLMTLNALQGRQLPVYGKGSNVRDWLHVDDHAAALIAVLDRGRVGETYNVGGNCELRNIDVVQAICDIFDALRPRADAKSHRELINFVQDRPGHDQRYAIDASKIHRELGFAPRIGFKEGLRQVVEWYVANQDWCADALTQYDGCRLGSRRPAGTTP